MLTKAPDYRESYDALPESTKGVILALSVLSERIRSLSKADRDDLFELAQAWRLAEDPEEIQSIQRAMEEILAQVPLTSRVLNLSEDKPLAGGLQRWAEHVGRRIQEEREQAGLTQTELAQRTGLPQSHISRIENAKHSPTHATLSKIASALNRRVEDIDPCTD